MSSEDRKPENLFNDLIVPQLERRSRKNTRHLVSVPATIQFKGQEPMRVNVLTISAKGLKINQHISISYADKCTITFHTKPQMKIICLPFIGDPEFNAGTWDRLRFINEIALDKVIALFKASGL